MCCGIGERATVCDVKLQEDNMSLTDSCFSSGTDGQKNLRVHLINPPINEPWRTKKDYIEDREAFAELQKQALEAHERSVEAHEILKKSYRNQTISLVVVTLTLVATIIATATGVIEFVVSQK